VVNGPVRKYRNKRGGTGKDFKFLYEEEKRVMFKRGGDETFDEEAGKKLQ